MAWPRIFSISVCATTEIAAVAALIRRARIAVCATDSSPVAYNTGPRLAKPAKACSSNVDLPTPGSPPSKISEPATKPPPSTRSSSAMPEARRSVSTWSLTWSRRTGDWPSATPAALTRGGAIAWSSSTRVFHSWQVGQRPSHLVSTWPHAVQRCCGLLRVGLSLATQTQKATIARVKIVYAVLASPKLVP